DLAPFFQSEIVRAMDEGIDFAPRNSIRVVAKLVAKEFRCRIAPPASKAEHSPAVFAEVFCDGRPDITRRTCDRAAHFNRRVSQASSSRRGLNASLKLALL